MLAQPVAQSCLTASSCCAFVYRPIALTIVRSAASLHPLSGTTPSATALFVLLQSHAWWLKAGSTHNYFASTLLPL